MFVSAVHQDLEIQTAKLKAQGCEGVDAVSTKARYEDGYGEVATHDLLQNLGFARQARRSNHQCDRQTDEHEKKAKHVESERGSVTFSGICMNATIE